jgi:hypothetical protein
LCPVSNEIKRNTKSSSALMRTKIKAGFSREDQMKTVKESLEAEKRQGF